MHSLTFVIFTWIAVSVDISFAQSNCEIRNGIGQITDTQKLNRNTKVENCWTIKVPEQKNALIEVTKLTIDRTLYTSVSLKIEDRIIRPILEGKVEIRGLKDTTVTFYAENTRNANEVTAEFELNYKVVSLACDQADAFRCSETDCVPQSDVCNGVSNCENGADEKNCSVVIDTGDDNIIAARNKALQYLKDMMYVRGSWGDATPEAVIAIHLANGTDFQETLEEKLIAKDLELHVCEKRSLAKEDSEPPLASDVLAKFINALIAAGIDSSMNPTEDLVADLKTTVANVAANVKFQEASSYLALCNAKLFNEVITDIAAVKEALTKGNDDQKYYAILTVDCLSRQTDDQNVKDTVKLLKTAVRPLIRRQRNDGSFDSNFETTAKFVQAMMASNTSSKDWKQQAALDYLVKEIEKSRNNMPALVLTLPVLGNRTPAVIGRIGNSARGSVAKKNESRKKISLRYGDTNIISRTLEAKENITAFEFLQIAAEKDSTFSFQATYIGDKINIHKIAGLANDSTVGKYWQFYFVRDEAKHVETKLEEGLDAFMMTGVKELILWYKMYGNVSMS